MGKRDQFIELAQSQVGYTESGDNHTKYAEYFDTPKADGGAWQWFNTKKQSSPWCAVWICWLFCQILGADKARTFLGCPSPKNNCAAGVPYLWKYLTALGWEVKKIEGREGDIIFFNKNTHVGMIEAVIDGKYHTIEGNKGDKVGRGVYSKNSTKVYGIMRPNWVFVDNVQSDPIPSPDPQSQSDSTPAPSPTPNPDPPALAGDYRMVKVNTSLRIRSGPGTQYEVLGKLANGVLIKVLKTQGSWVKIDRGWVSSGYLVTVIVKNYFVRVNSYLTVRSGPGTGYKAVDKLYNDNVVTVYNRQGTWGQIGVKRWVSMNYLE